MSHSRFQSLTLIYSLIHNYRMKKLIICIFIFWGLAGCSQEEEPIPSFPKIDNPLDREDKLKSTSKEAVDFSEISITIENEIEILRLSTNGERYNGWVKKSYENGKLGYLFHSQNGMQDGLYTAWYRNGKKMVERTWKNGMRNGPFKLWTDAGILDSRGFNQNNLRDGLFEEFYAVGKIKSKIEYSKGRIQTFLRWKPDGTKCPDTLVKAGTGLVIHYKEDGTVDSNESYLDGEYDYGYTSDINETSLNTEDKDSNPINLNTSQAEVSEDEVPVIE